jgi:cell division septation protein DedD
MEPFQLKSYKQQKPPMLGGMLGLLIFFIIAIFGLSISVPYLVNKTELAAVISAVLVDLTNSDRSTNKIGDLTVSPVLTAAAQAKANDMAEKGYFAHVAPDGKDSWYWFRLEDYKFFYAGENLAVDFSDSVNVEDAWMNSPTHRANILNPNFTQIGIATAEGIYQGHPTTFVVQMFGTPSSSQLPAAVQTITSPSEPTQPALATTIAPKPVPATTSAPAVATSAPAAVAPTPTPATTTATIAAAPTTTQAAVLGTEVGAVNTAHVSWWKKIIASPQTVLRYAYYTIALLILITLAYVTDLEFHKRHTRHLVAAIILLALMLGLFIAASSVFFTVPVLATA